MLSYWNCWFGSESRSGALRDISHPCLTARTPTVDLALANLSYLTRRGAGRYYLQIRMPPGPSWPALLRLSLHTSDARLARRNLCNALAWLIPLRDADSLTRQAEEILDQCRRFVRAGSATTWPDLEDRKRFEVTFATFAKEVRHYNVPDEVRLPLLTEWAFFTDMLRRDQVRMYEAGGTSPSRPPPQSADGPGRDSQMDGSAQSQPSHGAPSRRGKSKGKKLSALLAEFLADERQARGHHGTQGDVGIYVEFMIALLGDRAIATIATTTSTCSVVSLRRSRIGQAYRASRRSHFGIATSMRRSMAGRALSASPKRR